MEAPFFGVPIVVTHSANIIERRIADHYIDHWGVAVRRFKLDKCFEFVKGAMNGSEEYMALKKNRVPRELYGGEGIADVIFAELDKKYHIMENYAAEKAKVE